MKKGFVILEPLCRYHVNWKAFYNDTDLDFTVSAIAQDDTWIGIGFSRGREMVKFNYPE